jgi:hypothetical protein
MYSLSDEQVEYIISDIKSRGIELEEIQNSLVDHVCCIIEETYTGEEDFQDFYLKTISGFFTEELKEIEEETIRLLTFKNYYAMKNTMNISGFISSVLMAVGAFFKIMHWPGASLLLIIGILIFSFVFIPVLITLKFKQEGRKTEKFIFTVGLICFLAAVTGILFKTQHWPFANLIMRTTLLVFVFGYIPAYFLTNFRIQEKKFSTIINSVLMLAGGGLLLALSNPFNSKKVDNNLIKIADQLETQTEFYSKGNQEYYRILFAENSVDTNEQANKIRSASGKMADYLENLRWFIIAVNNEVSKEEAKSISIMDISYPNDHEKLTQIMDGKVSPEFSAKALLKKIEIYNASLDFTGINKPQPIVSSEEEFTETVTALAVFRLIQLQQQVLINEMMQLNNLKGINSNL